MERPMKLCAIYNLWGNMDLLQYSFRSISSCVEGVIAVHSHYSNYGEYSPNKPMYTGEAKIDIHFFNFEPSKGLPPMVNETGKRNFGLQKARELGYTHFITMDEDECYNVIDVLKARAMFKDDHELIGLVVNCQTFFKSPTLTIGLDTTLVPFIHKITPTLKHEFNRSYPFSWIDGQIRIDPTRSFNINHGVKRINMTMFHFSWVRKDYQQKIRNSTARANIEKSTIMQDLLLAKDGEICNFYGKILHTVPNYFNIPEYDVMV